VKQKVIETHGDAWTQPGNFVGNGPFVLDRWDGGSKIVLGRNDAWYGPAPTLTSIEVSIIADEAVAYNAYINNELDVVQASTASLASGANQDELVVTPELGTHAVFMNGATPPFDNSLVRQAIGSAIDREAYVNAVLQGTGQATTSWVPRGMPGYNDALGRNMSYDPARARELLAKAGYAGGQGLGEIEFIMIASDQDRLVGQFLEDQLETNLGIEVKFEYYDEGQYYDEFFAGNFGATIQSWFADWPSPENFLYGLFHSNGGANLVGYSNPNYDRLLDDAAMAGDWQTRLDLYDQAQKLLLEDAVIAPLYNAINKTYVKPSVLDLIITGIDGALRGDSFFWKTKIIVPTSD
jgi:oligopeptide transport system substrate-binding protein